MTEVKALILAGGLGTRLRPLTNTTPKCLVPVGGRPLLDYWLDRLWEADIRQARVNNHHLPEALRAYIAKINSFGKVQLEESFEPKLLGSAGTISDNRALAEDASEIVLIYADNLSEVSLVDMLRFHRNQTSPLTMLLFRTPHPSACGIATLDEHSQIVDFVEKPSEPTSDLANAGVYIVSAEAYREIADMKAFDLGFDVLPRFAGRMSGFTLEGYHRDIGTLASLEQANTDIATLFTNRKAFDQ